MLNLLGALLVDAGATGNRLGLTARSGRVDGYLSLDDLATLMKEYALTPDLDGSVVVRATSFDLIAVRRIAEQSPLLVAVDLAGSLDTRERSVGREAAAGVLRTGAPLPGSCPRVRPAFAGPFRTRAAVSARLAFALDLDQPVVKAS